MKAETATVQQENVALGAERTRLANHVEHLQEEQRAMDEKRHLLVTQIAEARDHLAQTQTNTAMAAASLSTLQRNQQTLQVEILAQEKRCAVLRAERAELEEATAQEKNATAQARRDATAQARDACTSMVQGRYLALPDKPAGREPKKIIPVESLADGAVNVLGEGLGFVLTAGDKVVSRIRSFCR